MSKSPKSTANKKRPRAQVAASKVSAGESLVATKPLKGPAALALLKEMGIVSPDGKLTPAYR